MGGNNIWWFHGGRNSSRVWVRRDAHVPARCSSLILFASTCSMRIDFGLQIFIIQFFDWCNARSRTRMTRFGDGIRGCIKCRFHKLAEVIEIRWGLRICLWWKIVVCCASSLKISVGRLNKISNQTLSKSFTQIGKSTTSEIGWHELKRKNNWIQRNRISRLRGER